MEDAVPATKLELWCEEWWRNRGYDVKIAARELAYTIYNVGGEEVRVPLMLVGEREDFKQAVMTKWR